MIVHKVDNVLIFSPLKTPFLLLIFFFKKNNIFFSSIEFSFAIYFLSKLSRVNYEKILTGY